MTAPVHYNYTEQDLQRFEQEDPHNGTPTECDLGERVRLLISDLREAKRFKTNTHLLLDGMGIPKCQGEECRIAARLEWIQNERTLLKNSMVGTEIQSLVTAALKDEVENPYFWLDRILQAWSRGGQLHEIIYNTSLEIWHWLQDETARLLAGRGTYRNHTPIVRDGMTVLDAGCGYGALLDVIDNPITRLTKGSIRYIGIDLSPHLIRIGQYRYIDPKTAVRLMPNAELIAGDLRNPKLLSTLPEFDLVIARSLSGMIMERGGEWPPILKNLCALSKSGKVLSIGYPTEFRQPVPFEWMAMDG